MLGLAIEDGDNSGVIRPGFGLIDLRRRALPVAPQDNARRGRDRLEDGGVARGRLRDRRLLAPRDQRDRIELRRGQFEAGRAIAREVQEIPPAALE